jgi:hypothetical protein
MRQLDYGYLLAGAAVLVALLSLWANLWISFGRNKDDADRRKAATSLGLFWIYCATVVALLAIGLVLLGKYWEGASDCWRDMIHGLGFAFLITAYLMSLLNMFESSFSIFYKASKGLTAFDSHPDLKSTMLNTGLLTRLTVSIVLLLACSIMVVLLNHWFWILYIPIVAYLICLYRRTVKGR